MENLELQPKLLEEENKEPLLDAQPELKLEEHNDIFENSTLTVKDSLSNSINTSGIPETQKAKIAAAQQIPEKQNKSILIGAIVAFTIIIALVVYLVYLYLSIS